jgi:hypothetical protein
VRAQSVNAAPSSSPPSRNCLPASGAANNTALRLTPLQELKAAPSKTGGDSRDHHGLHKNWSIYTQLHQFCDKVQHHGDVPHGLRHPRYAVSCFSERLEPKWLRYKTDIMDNLYKNFFNLFYINP